jgi:formylglycine-generating enzyme required for sulfatase activity
MKRGKHATAFVSFVFTLIVASPFVVAESRGLENVVAACAKRCPVMKRIDGLKARDAPGARSVSSTAALFVSVHPITFAQWEHCVRSGGCGGYRPDRQGLASNSPVINVSYDDATLYVRWLSTISRDRYRLVYEDEWPHIALAGRTSAFACGEAQGRGNANCLNCGSRWDGVSVSPVASFNANDFGLFDTMGNVAHWTAARLSSGAAIKGTEATGYCKGKLGYSAIVNASWAEPAIYMRADDFTCFPQVLRDDTIGFRVAFER